VRRRSAPVFAPRHADHQQKEASSDRMPMRRAQKPIYRLLQLSSSNGVRTILWTSLRIRSEAAIVPGWQERNHVPASYFARLVVCNIETGIIFNPQRHCVRSCYLSYALPVSLVQATSKRVCVPNSHMAHFSNSAIWREPYSSADFESGSGLRCSPLVNRRLSTVTRPSTAMKGDHEQARGRERIRIE
jgi:hypothetical protein